LKHKYFLDANVLISGLLWKGNERNLLEHGRRDNLRLITSDYALQEVRDFLVSSDFKPERIDESLLYLKSICEVVHVSRDEVRRYWDELDDKNDVPILAAAIRSKAILVTGDKPLTEKAKKFLTVMNARMVLDEV
jgi:putative PIN family toxin of toxin-antitoxin system